MIQPSDEYLKEIREFIDQLLIKISEKTGLKVEEVKKLPAKEVLDMFKLLES